MLAKGRFGWALFAGTLWDILATGVMAVISSYQKYVKNFKIQYLQTLVVTFFAIPI